MKTLRKYRKTLKSIGFLVKVSSTMIRDAETIVLKVGVREWGATILSSTIFETKYRMRRPKSGKLRLSIVLNEVYHLEP